MKKIYDKLPHFLKIFALNLVGFRNRKKRYTKQFFVFFKEHKYLWNKDIEKIQEYQKNELKTLLIEAFLYSDWYKSKMENIGITLDEIKKSNPFSVLAKMPILSKKDRKNNTELLVNTNRKTIAVDYSSGTSGSPTKNYIDQESVNKSFALWKRFHYTIGIKPTVKQVRFSGKTFINPNKVKPPFWIYNYFESQLLMSSYHLKEKNAIHYINKLNKLKPELIDGYPSAIYIISKYINYKGIKLSFKPKAIAVTAETLYDYQRNEIEKAFNSKVYNQYASSEGSPFITECTKGNLHLNLDSGIFEFLNEKEEIAKPGEIANLIVTSFTNLKTPLIRYNIGDTVLLPKNKMKCDCDCKMPIVEKIIGREDDILWTVEKGYVGRIGPAFKGLVHIIKSQIIQTNPSEFIINIIVNEQFNSSMEKELLKNLKDRLGNNPNFKINKVLDIPLGPNGKYKTVKRLFEIKK